MTEMFDVIGGRGATGEDALPQPPIRQNPAMIGTRKEKSRILCFLLMAKEHTTKDSSEPTNSRLGTRPRAAETAGVVIVSVTDVGAPAGVTVAGVKVHVAPAGSPEQLKDTAEWNPLSGVTVTVAVAF